MEEKEAINTPLVVVIGLVSVILLFTIIVALQAVYYNFEGRERADKVYSQVYQEAARLRADQEAELNSYSWIDRDDGVVGIPINRAIELAAREIGSASENDERTPETP
jgi:hypothetical protein